jgi:hypothetical protein
MAAKAGLAGNREVEEKYERKKEQELLQRLDKALQEKGHGASTSGTSSIERQRQSTFDPLNLSSN